MESTQVVVTAEERIDEIVGTLRLRPKESCLCVHTDEVAFFVSGQQRQASVCNSCFQYDGRVYEMPKDFNTLRKQYRDSTHLVQFWHSPFLKWKREQGTVGREDQ
jgi:hypothetical protein